MAPIFDRALRPQEGYAIQILEEYEELFSKKGEWSYHFQISQVIPRSGLGNLHSGYKWISGL